MSLAPSLPLFSALTGASIALGRLDQALRNHPLAPAVLHRMRLEAVRQQASSDGYGINMWHLAAAIENLPLRLGDDDRGSAFDAARYTLDQYRWMTDPDFDKEGAVREAEAFLASRDRTGGPVLQAGLALHGWLHEGHSRAPMRAALVRHWRRTFLHNSLPLTGAAALQGDVAWDREIWLPLFLEALAAEAEEGLRILSRMEYAWRQARDHLGTRRRNSRAGAALEAIAGAPLISVTTLAKRLAMAPKNVLVLLGQFAEAGIVVEVTHRRAHRLYGLAGMTPLRGEVALPRRARGGASGVNVAEDDDLGTRSEIDAQSFTPIERWQPDFGDLEAAMQQAEAAIRKAQRRLAQDSAPPA